MTTAANYREVESARAYLEANDYQIGSHENGLLIVQDPVMRSGYVREGSHLITAGFHAVALLNLRDALRFVLARSYFIGILAAGMSAWANTARPKQAVQTACAGSTGCRSKERRGAETTTVRFGNRDFNPVHL